MRINEAHKKWEKKNENRGYTTKSCVPELFTNPGC